MVNLSKLMAGLNNNSPFDNFYFISNYCRLMSIVQDDLCELFVAPLLKNQSILLIKVLLAICCCWWHV